MRKSHICLVLIFVIGTVAFIAPMFPSSHLNTFLNWGLVSALLVILAIVAFFFEFERTAVSSKEIALSFCRHTQRTAKYLPDNLFRVCLWASGWVHGWRHNGAGV